MERKTFLERIGLRVPRVFVSYRRSDAAGHAGRLLASLTDYYGARDVYLDYRSIRGGDDFAVELERALRHRPSRGRSHTPVRAFGAGVVRQLAIGARVIVVVSFALSFARGFQYQHLRSSA